MRSFYTHMDWSILDKACTVDEKWDSFLKIQNDLVKHVPRVNERNEQQLV